MVQSNSEVSATASVRRGSLTVLSIKEFGVFEFVVRDADGNIKEIKTATNALTTEGATQILTLWRTTAGDTTLYVGLLEGAVGSLLPSETLATNEWTEAAWSASTPYARQAWNPGTPSSGSLTAATSSWDMAGLSSGNQVLTGAFLTNSDVAASDVGKQLIATSAFTGGSTITLGDNDTLTITFTITLS